MLQYNQYNLFTFHMPHMDISHEKSLCGSCARGSGSRGVHNFNHYMASHTIFVPVTPHTRYHYNYHIQSNTYAQYTSLQCNIWYKKTRIIKDIWNQEFKVIWIPLHESDRYSQNRFHQHSISRQEHRHVIIFQFLLV